MKDREAELPEGTHDRQSFDVNGEYAMLAVKFDWFSISMLNLMEGVSLLDTLAQNEAEGDYVELASKSGGMNIIRSSARTYTDSIPEAGPLRLWRDKVAAHRSGILPPPPKRPGDSMATRLISLMGAQVMARNGRYVAPALKPGVVEPDPSASELQQLSLTETWESLASQRYQWLDDGSFFEDISSMRLGEGRHLRSFELASGEAAVGQMMKQLGIELPKE